MKHANERRLSNKEAMIFAVCERLKELLDRNSAEIDIHIHLGMCEVPTLSYSVKGEWVVYENEVAKDETN